jgi:hypothetical protein
MGSYNNNMRYSLRTLMIVVTLLSVAFSALAARSRQCAEQAAEHRKGLPSEQEMKEIQALVDATRVPVGENCLARLRFRHGTVAAYERVSRMPWLPLLLPSKPVEKPVYRCSMDLDPEFLEQARELLNSQP